MSPSPLNLINTTLVSVSLHDVPRNREYSKTPLIRTLVIRNADNPDRLGPSGKHFLTVILLNLFMV